MEMSRQRPILITAVTEQSSEVEYCCPKTPQACNRHFLRPVERGLMANLRLRTIVPENTAEDRPVSGRVLEQLSTRIGLRSPSSRVRTGSHRAGDPPLS